MQLVVGLGNPGAEYAATPHNAGFRVCERLAERHGFERARKRFKGLFRRGTIRGRDVGLLQPQTYMNLSGEAVAAARRYLPVEIVELLIVYDEMDLPAGRLRVRGEGGHAGHNGMRSVIEHLGRQDFARLRIGVGRPREGRDPTGHLLSRLPTEERQSFEETIERATDAVEVMLCEGVEAAMNRFNAPVQTDDDREGAP